MGYQKVKTQEWKEREKDSQIIVWQKEGYIFSAMKYCAKCAEGAMPEEKAEKG
jgi:hypothetical protein